MSLVQHVSAVEGHDREPLNDDWEERASLQLGRQRSRAGSFSLSYDPTPLALQKPAEKLEPLGAVEVSQNVRLGKLDAPSMRCRLKASRADLVIQRK